MRDKALISGLFILMDGSILTIVVVLGILFWIFLIYIVAKFGEARKLGFLWTLVAAIILSPLIAFLLAVISGRK